MDEVDKVMVRIEAIFKMKVSEGNCFYCRDASSSHTIGKCGKFKILLQKMMDHGEIEFFEKIVEESVNMITDAKFMGESSLGGPRPLTIFFEDDLILVANTRMNLPKLIVEVPSPFP